MFLKLRKLFNLKIGEGSPRSIFIVFVLYILGIEFAIMFVFELLDSENHIANAFMDAMALISLIIPAFYFLIYKPSLAHIIETKDLAKKIAESEKKFKNAFNLSAIGMALLSLDGKWLKVNSQICKLVGYSEEELLSMNFQEITHPDDLTTDLNFVKQLIANEFERFEVEKRYFHKNGTIIWVLIAVSLVRDNDGVPLYFISQTIDVNRRKKAEESLEIKTKNLEKLFNLSLDLKDSLKSSATMQLIIDKSTHFVGMDTGAIYLIKEDKIYLNATTPNLQTDFPEEFKHDKLANHPHIKKCIDLQIPIYLEDLAKSQLTSEERIICEKRGLRSVIYLPLNTNNKPIGVIIVGTQHEVKSFSESEMDVLKTVATIAGITVENFLLRNETLRYNKELKQSLIEVKKSKQKISSINQSLEKMNTEKDKFFSIIAHDLRSPFNGFLGLTNLLAEKNLSLSTEKIQKIAENMNKSAQQIFVLLENLLLWARSERGLVSITPVNIELYTLIIENVNIIKESTLKKDIKISLNIPNDTIVFADINMTHTIIRNLICNALKFTPNGGEITISAKIYEDKNVLIAVKDTGIGMDQTMLDNLFRIDVKTNRTGTNNEPSSGLGLLLCKDFVKKNDGKIWVESEENKGSVFYVTLPKAADKFIINK